MIDNFIEKDHSQIVEEMLIEFANELGVNEISSASDIAIKAKVLASQIEALIYNQNFILKQAFPQTATGNYLDDHTYPFGKDRKKATKSVGTVAMGRESPSDTDILIPKGTMFSTNPEVYGKLITGVTTEDATLPAEILEIIIPAEVEIVGEEGNVEAGSFTVLNSPPTGIEYVTNNDSFKDGTNDEEDETFRDRFFNSIRKPSLGGTKTDYENWALEVDGVTLAKCLTLNRGPGTVDVLIATSSGVPSDELLTETFTYIESKRPIGADVQVLKPEVVNIDVSSTITPKSGYTVDTLRDSVEDAIKSYIKSIEVGGIVKISALINTIYKVNGVDDVDITLPTGNIVLTGTQVAQVGVINVQ